MSTFDCADNLICATLSGSEGIGVGLVTGTPNKIVVSASNIPNSALANSAININGTTYQLGQTASIGDITAVNAGNNLTGGGSSGDVTISLTSSITGGLDSISGINNIYTSFLTASNIQVLGTASVAMLNTVNQQSLQIGDKYIIIMSGATDHTSLSGSGILWGSGSTGPTVGPNGENAYVRYDSVNDQLVIYPGLKSAGGITSSNGGFSGSGANITNISTANISNFNSTVQGLITGSTNITVTNGTASLNSTVVGLSALTSSFVSASTISSSVGVSGALGLFTNLTGTNISGTTVQFATITGSNISGTSAQYTRITGSSISGSTLTYTTLSGTYISASQISGSHTGSGAGLFSLTASGISNFTNDVRAQFSQGTGIIINNGAVSASNIPNSSLQNTGSTIGSTPIILGSSTSGLSGLTSLSSLALTGTNLITGSTISASVGVSGALGLFNNLTASNISGTNNLYVGGNVGIGDSSPVSKLSVAGVIDIKDASQLLNFKNQNGSTRFGYIFHSGASGYMQILNNQNGLLALGTNNVDLLYLSGSNVGIGTNNPSAYKLQVNGTISGSTIYGNGSGLTSIPNSSLVNSYISINSTQVQLGNNIDISTGAGTVNPGNQFRLAYYPNADGGTTVDDASDLYYRSSKLGIGVDPSSTTFKLQISSSTAQGGASINNTNAQYTYSLSQDRSWNLHLHSIATDPSVATIGHLVLTSPVADAVNPAALFFGVSGTTEENSYSWIQSRAANAEGSGYSRKILSLNPNGGSVGIGTTTPNSTLDINGNTIITGSLIVGDTNKIKINDNNISSTGSLMLQLSSYNQSFNISNIAVFAYRRFGIIAPYSYYNTASFFGTYAISNSAYTNDTNLLSVNGLMQTNLNINASANRTVYQDTSGFLCTTSSDRRLKKNIITIDNALDKIIKLNGVYFNWTNENYPEFNSGDETVKNIGLIAQEVEEVLPELVCLNGVKDYKTVKYAELTSVLVEGIKELKKENDQLKSTLNDILARLAALENK